ncbi:hypothetical protein SAMN05216525_10586 [Bradyrhizobium sp. Gha]|nr:hypothetical protein SAMN05216525_10586 [Bradyrhizobium sp. Gha]
MRTPTESAFYISWDAWGRTVPAFEADKRSRRASGNLNGPDGGPPTRVMRVFLQQSGGCPIWLGAPYRRAAKAIVPETNCQISLYGVRWTNSPNCGRLIAEFAASAEARVVLAARHQGRDLRGRSSHWPLLFGRFVIGAMMPQDTSEVNPGHFTYVGAQGRYAAEPCRSVLGVFELVRSRPRRHILSPVPQGTRGRCTRRRGLGHSEMSAPLFQSSSLAERRTLWWPSGPDFQPRSSSSRRPRHM